MYSISDKGEAIRQVQRYLSTVGNPNIFVAPTGVYDDNTRLSVKDFQSSKSVEESGVADRITFDLLFKDFEKISERDALRGRLDSFIVFPLLPGDFSDSMMHVNRTLARLLDHYRVPHGLRSSNFYSESTGNAVASLRAIYLLEQKDLIDEELYIRMIRDHASIDDARENFL